MLDRPIFVIDCGVFGAHPLAAALCGHPQTKLIDDPRELWSRAFPLSDLWTKFALILGGRLALDTNDWDAASEQRLRQLFEACLESGRSRICEAFHVDAFRLGLINRLFPDARYVHLEREPLDAAHSIVRTAASTDWYGFQDCKWTALADLASREPGLAERVVEATSPLHRGLIEWALSGLAVRRALRAWPNRILTLSYSALVEQPLESARAIEEACELGPSPTDRRWLKSTTLPPESSAGGLDELGARIVAAYKALVAAIDAEAPIGQGAQAPTRANAPLAPLSPWPLPKAGEARCNICGGRNFTKDGLIRRPDQLPPLCLGCHSVERHRAIRLVYDALKPMLSTMRVFQFAPDSCVERSWFKRFVGSVFNGENSTDMLDTGLAPGSFDLVISNHVLEHVADDRKAVLELLRVVGPSGVVHYCVPSPMFRWKNADWGFADPARNWHYREYGADFPQLLKEIAPRAQVISAMAVDPATGVADFVYFQSENLKLLERMAGLLSRSLIPFARF